jgi:hypothetical protein
VALFAVGMLYLLQGFRFARILLAITNGAGGFLLAFALASTFKVPAFLAGVSVGGLLGAIALLRFRAGIVLGSGFVFAVLGYYLAGRFTIDPMYLLTAGGIGGALGLSMNWICYRSLPVIVTTVQGTALLIIAFVGLSSNLAPSLSATFVEWGDRIPLMMPLMMTMLFTLGYSVQANMQQGDMLTGAGKGWNSAEAA